VRDLLVGEERMYRQRDLAVGEAPRVVELAGDLEAAVPGDGALVGDEARVVSRRLDAASAQVLDESLSPRRRDENGKEVPAGLGARRHRHQLDGGVRDSLAKASRGAAPRSCPLREARQKDAAQDRGVQLVEPAVQADVVMGIGTRSAISVELVSTAPPSPSAPRFLVG